MHVSAVFSVGGEWVRSDCPEGQGIASPRVQQRWRRSAAAAGPLGTVSLILGRDSSLAAARAKHKHGDGAATASTTTCGHHARGDAATSRQAAAPATTNQRRNQGGSSGWAPALGQR